MGRMHGKGAGTVAPANVHLTGKARERERASNRPSTSSGEAAVVGRHRRKRSEGWTNGHLLKADELDRIYATDNYAPGERRSTELPPKRSNDGGMGFDADVEDKKLRDQDFDGRLELKDCIVPLDISRGRFYERYMQIREAKKREEWGLERDLKMAKMKALEERLEESRADMEAVFSRSGSRYRDAMLVNRKVEKLEPFTGHAMGNKAEASAGKGSVEVDNGKGRYTRQIPSSGKSLTRTLSNTFVSSGSTSSPATPRTPSATPRSFSRHSTGTGKHRTKLEKPAGHSVSNMPDLKRNNDRPLNGIGMAASQVQPRIYTPRKSTNENVAPIKEERRSHQPPTPRKKTINSVECNGLATPRKMGVSHLKPPQENPVHKRAQRVIQPKSTHTKGRGATLVGRNCTTKKRDMASLYVRDEGLKGLLDQQDSPSNMVLENGNIEEESLEVHGDQVDGSSSMAKEEGQLEIISTKEFKEIDEEKSELGTASIHSWNPDSEMDEALLSNAPMQIDSSSAMIVIASEDGISAETKEELPTLQNDTHAHNSISSVKESSGVNAFDVTPVSSPAEWHTHTSYQTTKDDSTCVADENPGLAANAPRHTPKRDLAKAIRRLLNFGRKKREPEKLAKNQLSASTNSEGEFDMEENHQLTNHLSGEVGKSRLGFSEHHYIRNDSIEVTTLYDQGRRSEGSTPIPENQQMTVDNIPGTLIKVPRPFTSLTAFKRKGCI